MVTISALNFYITIVSNQSTLRSMLTACREIDASYLESEIEDVDNFIIQSEEKFKQSIEKRRVSSFKSIDEVAQKVKTEIDNMKAIADDEVIGLNTGYRRINYYTQGWRKGDMIVIAARPSVGKTALAVNFAWQAAFKYHTPVAIFSLEMPAEQLVKRLIASASAVSLKKITTGTITGSERNTVANAIREVAQAPIYIDDTPGNKLMDIIAKSRKLLAKEKDLGLIVIDYLGLVETGSKGGKSSGDSRQEEVRKISLALKGLARELNVPIIIISQLSRDVEKRETKKPMMSDLRDSGSIEQDADVILLLYREDYYSDGEKKKYENKKGGRLTQNDKFEIIRDQKKKELGTEMPASTSYVEVNIAKNRNGQCGRVGLFFLKEYSRFESPSEEWEEAMLKVSEQDAD
jgi:replicative DNA helicase